MFPGGILDSDLGEQAVFIQPVADLDPRVAGPERQPVRRIDAQLELRPDTVLVEGDDSPGPVEAETVNGVAIPVVRGNRSRNHILGFRPSIAAAADTIGKGKQDRDPVTAGPACPFGKCGIGIEDVEREPACRVHGVVAEAVETAVDGDFRGRAGRGTGNLNRVGHAGQFHLGSLSGGGSIRCASWTSSTRSSHSR